MSDAVLGDDLNDIAIVVGLDAGDIFDVLKRVLDGLLAAGTRRWIEAIDPLDFGSVVCFVELDEL